MMMILLYAALILFVSCFTAVAIARIDVWCSEPFSDSECPAVFMPVGLEWEAFLEVREEGPAAT